MSASEHKLLSLLFSEGRTLNNLKFFPGPECTSPDQMFDAASEFIAAAVAADDGDMLPVESQKPVAIAELVASL